MTTEEVSPEEQQRRDMLRAEVLELLVLRQSRGVNGAISLSQLAAWISPSLKATSGHVGIAVAILEREGRIEIERRLSPNGARLPNKYTVV